MNTKKRYNKRKTNKHIKKNKILSKRKKNTKRRQRKVYGGGLFDSFKNFSIYSNRPDSTRTDSTRTDSTEIDSYDNPEKFKSFVNDKTIYLDEIKKNYNYTLKVNSKYNPVDINDIEYNNFLNDLKLIFNQKFENLEYLFESELYYFLQMILTDIETQIKDKTTDIIKCTISDTIDQFFGIIEDKCFKINNNKYNIGEFGLFTNTAKTYTTIYRDIQLKKINNNNDLLKYNIMIDTFTYSNLCVGINELIYSIYTKNLNQSGGDYNSELKKYEYKKYEDNYNSNTINNFLENNDKKDFLKKYFDNNKESIKNDIKNKIEANTILHSIFYHKLYHKMLLNEDNFGTLYVNELDDFEIAIKSFRKNIFNIYLNFVKEIFSKLNPIDEIDLDCQTKTYIPTQPEKKTFMKSNNLIQSTNNFVEIPNRFGSTMYDLKSVKI